MIRLKIGGTSATLHGVEWFCSDDALRQRLTEIAAPIIAARPGYLPPPQDQILEAVRAAFPQARITKRVRPEWKPDRVY